MSDEDPKSLLFLCDDTLREMLSYMPLKSRVRHSGTCTAMYQVVDQSLLSVKSLDDQWNWTTDTESRLKTLSKLKNLETVTYLDAETESGIRDEIIDVIVNNCQYIEWLQHWDMALVVQFVRGLVEKGLPVRLKMIQDDIHGEESLLRYLMEKTSASIAVDSEDYELITNTGSWDRVVQVEAYDLMSLPVKLMTKVTSLTHIHVEVGEGDQLHLILKSLPLVTDIQVSVDGNGDKLLQILAEADNEFEDIELRVDYSPPDEKGVDYLKRMLEAKGRKLRSLHLNLTDHNTESKDHILRLIHTNCPHLKYFHFDYSGIDSNIGFDYSERVLDIKLWGTMSFQSLLPIIPDVRMVYIRDWHLLNSQIPETMMEELREFASGKKKYCIIVKIGFLTFIPREQITSSFDQNLHIIQEKETRAVKRDPNKRSSAPCM